MRKYELVCILHPDLDETAFNDALDKIKGWIGESEGSVDSVDNWGRRKMAYMPACFPAQLQNWNANCVFSNPSCATCLFSSINLSGLPENKGVCHESRLEQSNDHRSSWS
jgi:hypothetical protein